MAACGASMRPIPDDVEPVPKTASRAVLADAGPLAAEGDAAVRLAEGAHTAKPAPCADSRGRPLGVRQLGPDRWIIASGVVDVIRRERKAIVSPQIDAQGRITGLAIVEVGTGSCLGAIGFVDGDVLRSINSQPMDADGLSSDTMYQSIQKSGAAVVRFERGGRAMTVLYEVQGG